MKDRYHFNFGNSPDAMFEILEWYDSFQDMRLILQRVRRSHRQDKAVSLAYDSFTLLVSAVEKYSREVDTETAADVWVELQGLTRGKYPDLYEDIQEAWTGVER